MTSVPRIEDFADRSYDPFHAAKTLGGEGHVGNFYPRLHELRSAGPVMDGSIRAAFDVPADLTVTGLRHAAVLGHAEVKTVLLDTSRFSNHAYHHNMIHYFGDSITTMDDPDHRRYRKLFEKAFMPKMVARFGEEVIPRMIDRLIDNFADRGHAELVSEFTLHFPFHFIHELMALPDEDRDIFHRLAFAQIYIGFDPEHALDAVGKLKTYITAVIEDRRAHPREGDFISTIANAEVEGERLPDPVVISFFRQLMNAGGDTSFNGFSSVLAALLTHPEQLEAVKRDRALVPKAIEEGLRWDCPVTAIFRTPKEPLELSGVKLEPGDYLTVMLSSANRDPAAFDRPDSFDISRATRNHAAFGYGSHMCIGQHLARLEMASALNALLDRLPALRADPAAPPPEISGFSLRSPSAIHVRFD